MQSICSVLGRFHNSIIAEMGERNYPENGDNLGLPSEEPNNMRDDDDEVIDIHIHLRGLAYEHTKSVSASCLMALMVMLSTPLSLTAKALKSASVLLQRAHTKDFTGTPRLFREAKVRYKGIKEFKGSVGLGTDIEDIDIVMISGVSGETEVGMGRCVKIESGFRETLATWG
ncbi:hypothetical protein Clacol_009759 [Clathrus columnatus]|uniref:Uncharacterized protein n=1 Tax=Clathrus columnatus TaxID=1419009 RepID=A0AAV5ALF2_9AGAM|nr:hypothetical protein Clacol_009759 [Clathrus columnatus]